jgi:crotonobetainyl-CoA:carnitine CoA-transferase CaiB-like acyl-CoA transferase
MALEYGAHGVRLARDGNRGPVGAPQNLYACRGVDRWLALAVASDDHWQALVEAMGRPAWSRDEALATAAGRRAAHDVIDAAIGAWCADRDAEALAEDLVARGIPAAPVVSAARLEGNPQLRARGFFQTVVHPVVGTHAHPTLPLGRPAERVRWFARAAPMLGEHTEEILRELLGLDHEAIARLRAEGIIGSRPLGL